MSRLERLSQSVARWIQERRSRRLERVIGAVILAGSMLFMVAVLLRGWRELEPYLSAVDLRLVEVRTGTPPVVGVVLSASQRLGESHVDALKRLISERIGGAVVLEAQLNLRR